MAPFVVIFNAMMMIGGDERRELENLLTLMASSVLPAMADMSWKLQGDEGEGSQLMDLTDMAYVDDLLSMLVVDDTSVVLIAARLKVVDANLGASWALTKKLWLRAAKTCRCQIMTMALPTRRTE